MNPYVTVTIAGLLLAAAAVLVALLTAGRKDRSLAERDRRLAQKDRALAEKDRIIAAQERAISDYERILDDPGRRGPGALADGSPDEH